MQNETARWVHNGDPLDATYAEAASPDDLTLTDAQMDVLAERHSPVGYRVTRGSAYRTCDDRADRWYVERTDATAVDRRGPGHASLSEALGAADQSAVDDLPADLRAARDRLGYSQTKMAAALGVPMRTYQSWEGGQEPQHPDLIRLAVAEVERRS